MTDAVSRAAVLAILKTMPPGMEKQFGRLTRKIKALPGVEVAPDFNAVAAEVMTREDEDGTHWVLLSDYAELRAALDQIQPQKSKTPGL